MQHYWIKKLSSKGAIVDYLSKKKLPFELSVESVKYQILHN
jgi:hypothetical protein